MGLFNLLGLGTSLLFNSMHYTSCNLCSCPISSCLCDYKTRCFWLAGHFFPAHGGVLLMDHGITWVWLFNSWLENLHNTCADLLWPKFFMLKSSLPLSFKHHSTTGLRDSGLQYHTRIYIFHCGVCLALSCFVGHTVQYFVNCSCSSKSLSD